MSFWEAVARQSGFKVKRYKNSIQVDQIRELAGALVLGGMTRGVFVTTSDFQSGAASTADRLAARGLPIQLINASEFLQVLGVAQRAMFEFRDEVGPEQWAHALKVVSEKFEDKIW